MSRRICFRFRSLLAMLLAFCLVSVSLWSDGAEAMAGAMSDEIVLTAAGAGTHDHGPAEMCNHGCHGHAHTHLTGLECGSVSLPAPEATQTAWPQALVAVASHPRDGPFRPPRSSFQA